MASGYFSGSFNGQYSQYATPYIFWDYTQSISGNYTTVTATIYVKREKSGSSTTKSSTGWTLLIDESHESGTINFNIASVSVGDYIRIGSGTNNIYHDSQGQYHDITIKGTIDLSGTTLGKGTVESTISIPNIPRSFTGDSTIALFSKTSTSVTMYWTTTEACSTVQYKINNGDWVNVVEDANAKSGTYTITGLDPNTTYTITGDYKRRDTGIWSDNHPSVSVTTHARTMPTISLSSKTINSITVTSGCNVAVSSTQYRIKTSSGSYGSYQTSPTFTGLAANTSYVIEVRKVGTASGEAGTATLAVTTYNYATISTGGNFNLGDNETVTYSNPSGSTINIGIYTTDGTNVLAAYRVAGGSSYTFSFTDTELDTIYRRLRSNNSMTVRIYLRTTCNGSDYYSTKDVTVTLTGNQKTGHINISSGWKRSKKWININGTWKRCVRWINVNGVWKRCI